jgi:uncharacterized membrane protein
VVTAKDQPLRTDAERTDSASQPAHKERKRRRLALSLPGAWVALAFVALSFTPSLLPRSGLFQGVVAGITGAIGYGLGVVGAWLWRQFADRGARAASARSWRIFGITAVVVLLVAVILGERWQRQLRELMDADDDPLWGLLLMPVVAALVFLLLIGIGRGVRGIYRWVSTKLRQWIGPGAARGVGWVLVAALTIFILNGVLYQGFLDLADSSFAVRDTITPEGVEQPDSDLRSGSPGSLVDWDSMGREGRKFTATGPTVEQISQFTGAQGTEPIRAYAGAGNAADVEERARLAVADLDRAGGFSRAYLVVATTTGSGWLDPGAVDSFEYLTGGDSAIVGMQYSYLPSWISFLVDQQKAREAGRTLFDAVYERWTALPADDRPELVVFGESLGSFGGETAFSGEWDISNRTDGALFAGPPSFNTLYREFTDDRDEGSTEVEPVYREGRIVRFSNDVTEEIAPAGEPWSGTRVLYMQHPSDPIVWWSPRLLFNKPDWLGEERGSDVLDEMVWIPFVTFWQVTADLPGATAVPTGHGHDYRTDHVDGWAAVLEPEGWSTDKAAQLRELVREP